MTVSSPPAFSPVLCKRRFSLVELVAVIAVLGILGGALALGFGTATVGFLQGRDNLEVAQKVHVAMQRMTLELRFAALNEETGEVDIVVGDEGQTTVFRSKRDGELHVLTFVDSEVLLDRHTLMDTVNQFTIEFDPETSEVTILMDVGQIGEFMTLVHP